MDSEADSNFVARLLAGGPGQPTEGEALRLIYEELRVIAHSARKGIRPDRTLGTTALVHEVYMKLARNGAAVESRKHFYALAAKAMRQIVIDYARARTRMSNQRERGALEIEEIVAGLGRREIDLLVLDEALDRLAEIDPRKARVVELRFFGGMEGDRIAEYMGLSRATIERDWAFARAWLRRELSGEQADES